MEDIKFLKAAMEDWLATGKPDKCAPLLKEAARDNDLDSVLQLRKGHLQGLYGIEKDHEAAYKATKQAALLGDPVCMYHTAVVEESQGRYEEAYAWMRRAWNNDVKEAASALAKMHAFGQGTEKDLDMAGLWMERAIESGTEVRSGWLYQWVMKERAESAWHDGNSNGARDCLEAMESVDGWKCLAALSEGEKRQMWLEKAADAGDAESMMFLGILYWSETDWKNGTVWLKNAAKAGWKPAWSLIADAYETGTGVKMDKEEAARWRNML